MMMDINTIIHGDCLEVMKTLPDNSIDLILTDPPYGTTACDWDKVPDLELMWKEINRICKPNAAKIMTSSQPFTTTLIQSNIQDFRYEWVWKKTQATGGLNANKMPLKIHENVCVFYSKLPQYNPVFKDGMPYRINRKRTKESSPYGKTGMKDQFISENLGTRYPNSIIELENEYGDHPTQKPIELMKYFIRTYSTKGDLILDPFCGSGTTCTAAKQIGRNYIGIEITNKYYKLAYKRVNEAVEQLSFLEAS